MFGKKQADTSEEGRAKEAALAALPPGWTLGPSDLESYRYPGGSLRTYSAAARGPNGEVALVVALTEVEAWHALPLRVRGELPVTALWAPPVEQA
ncbi:MAG TPA: hypothetical protein VNA20_18495 [Frankiaceae bacterium]|nr:hypothetical protein [Frankiaceae bacterium]